jgi:hypothetical protein
MNTSKAEFVNSKIFVSFTAENDLQYNVTKLFSQKIFQIQTFTKKEFLILPIPNGNTFKQVSISNHQNFIEICENSFPNDKDLLPENFQKVEITPKSFNFFNSQNS